MLFNVLKIDLQPTLDFDDRIYQEVDGSTSVNGIDQNPRKALAHII